MNKWGKFSAILVVLLIILAYVIFVPRILAMSSANYEINWDSLNSGGTDYSTSANFQMLDTLGEIATGRSSSTNFSMQAGYRQGITDPGILEFKIFGQDETTKIAYSAFDNLNTRVTVADSTGYVVGGYLVAVEDMGPSQMIAVGQITGVVANVITVDKWDGDNAAMSAVPAGGDDWVFEITQSSVDLGTLSTVLVNTGVSITEVFTNAERGYTVTVLEDGNLRDGANDIDDVSDGTVTAGSEEYGIETVGTYATGINDFALDSAGQPVQVKTATGSRDRIGVIYKASVSPTTLRGNYSHIVSYYLTANF